KRATTDKSAQTPGSGDGATFNQSDSLSFYTFRRGEVDPRTGTFNYRIPVARLTGNQKLGPSVELYLSYNHFTDDDEGFGGGWSLGLSKFLFTNERRQVILRDGRVVNVDYDESTSTYTIKTVDIKDFILKKGSADDYLIIYKDGITETLSKFG